MSTAKYYSSQLDAIKTVAILFVVAFHFFPGQLGWHMRVMPPGWFEQFWSQPSPDILHFFESYLYLGVNLFVIASGFGLYLSHLKAGRAMKMKEFFVKRVWRLMPAALFSLVVLFFVKGLLLDQWVTLHPWLNLFPFLGGLNLFSDSWFFPPINGETWFLGLIIQLYLFFPLLVKFYERVGEKRFLLSLFLFSVAFRALYYVFWKDSVASLSYGLSLGRLFEFGFGMVVAKYFVHGKALSRWWIAGMFFAIGYFWAWTFPFADSLLGVGLFVLLWELFTVVGRKNLEKKKWSPGVFFQKASAKIALQSYFIFLLHHPFVWVLEKWGYHDAWSLSGGMVYLAFFFFSYCLAASAQKMLSFIEGFFDHRSNTSAEALK